MAKLDPESLLLKLLAIPGPSGQEAAVSKFVQKQLHSAGAEDSQIESDQAHLRSRLPGQTGNLVFRLPGTRRGPRRLLMAHLDTVPICVGADPVKRGRLIVSKNPTTGLGADNRAGCAVVLNTALRLLRERPSHPPLTFLWTVQEEVGLQGARLLKLAMLSKPQSAFNWDGGLANKVTIGATGGYRMEIDVYGKASHAGGAPERGVSSIVAAAEAIAQLHRGGWHGLIQQNGRTGTSNVGVIHGGAATNVVCDHVRVHAEARSHDKEFRAEIVRQIEDAFRTAASQIQNQDGQSARVEIQGRLDYEAFCLPVDHPTVIAARAAVERQAGTAELAVANGGLDANWLTERGIPTVTLGCGQTGQHTVGETLDLDEFHKACAVAWDLATEA